MRPIWRLNRLGMGLVEVMVASTIGVIVVTGMTTYMANQNKALRGVRVISTRDILSAQLARLASNTGGSLVKSGTFAAANGFLVNNNNFSSCVTGGACAVENNIGFTLTDGLGKPFAGQSVANAAVFNVDGTLCGNASNNPSPISWACPIVVYATYSTTASTITINYTIGQSDTLNYSDTNSMTGRLKVTTNSFTLGLPLPASGGGMGGSGTSSYISKWNNATTLGNSVMFESNTGNVGIGTNAPDSILTVTANPSGMQPPGGSYSGTIGHWTGADDSKARLLIDSFGFLTGPGVSAVSQVSLRSARGTTTAPTATQNNDVVGQYLASGYGQTSYPSSPALLQFRATENWTDTNHGLAIDFLTTQNTTAGSPLARMTLDHNGNVGIGTTTPSSKLAIRGDNSGVNGLSIDTISSGAGLSPVGIRMSNDLGTAAAGVSGTRYIEVDYTGSFRIERPIVASTYPDFMIKADGMVGIGVASPTAKLHIGGTSGVDGIKFPDGTLQTTAAAGVTGVTLYSLPMIFPGPGIEVLNMGTHKFCALTGHFAPHQVQACSCYIQTPDTVTWTLTRSMDPSVYGMCGCSAACMN